MDEQEIFSKNVTLSTEFDKYLIEHPEFAEQIPTRHTRPSERCRVKPSWPGNCGNKSILMPDPYS